MRYYISLIALAVISLSIFTACQTSAPVAEKTQTNSAPKNEDPLANAPRISLADAKKAFDDGNVVFVDTRAEGQYKVEHVKGSINIPAETFQTRYAEVPRDKKIITYCS
jgi:predicted sulfurtransferase